MIVRVMPALDGLMHYGHRCWNGIYVENIFREFYFALKAFQMKTFVKCERKFWCVYVKTYNDQSTCWGHETGGMPYMQRFLVNWFWFVCLFFSRLGFLLLFVFKPTSFLKQNCNILRGSNRVFWFVKLPNDGANGPWGLGGPVYIVFLAVVGGVNKYLGSNPLSQQPQNVFDDIMRPLNFYDDDMKTCPSWEWI